jgi:hypothetical protein
MSTAAAAADAKEAAVVVMDDEPAMTPMAGSDHLREKSTHKRHTYKFTVNIFFSQIGGVLSAVYSLKTC